MAAHRRSIVYSTTDATIFALHLLIATSSSSSPSQEQDKSALLQVKNGLYCGSGELPEHWSPESGGHHCSWAGASYPACSREEERYEDPLQERVGEHPRDPVALLSQRRGEVSTRRHGCLRDHLPSSALGNRRKCDLLHRRWVLNACTSSRRSTRSAEEMSCHYSTKGEAFNSGIHGGDSKKKLRSSSWREPAGLPESTVVMIREEPGIQSTVKTLHTVSTSCVPATGNAPTEEEKL